MKYNPFHLASMLFSLSENLFSLYLKQNSFTDDVLNGRIRAIYGNISCRRADVWVIPTWMTFVIFLFVF